jgi:carboxy-cis,cis-muconate cyclase
MDSTTNTRAIFVLAAKKSPYSVYGNPFYKYAGFGNIFAVDDNGGLSQNVQNYPYLENSSIHGMVFDPTESYLYSADMWADLIWCHRKQADGTLELVGSVKSPNPGDHPRWVAIHPSGKYLYVLMEAGNVLRLFSIDTVHIYQPILESLILWYLHVSISRFVSILIQASLVGKKPQNV